MTKPAFPDGHFYSPVVNPGEAIDDRAMLWETERPMRGIDLNPSGHEHLLREVFPPLLQGYDYPESGPSDDTLDRFYDFNGQFERQDPRVMYCLLQTVKPRRIVEVGSGYSTLLLLDMNARFFGDEASITCIEPYPRPFLQRAHDAGRITLIRERVQRVDERCFAELARDDVLFVDSSHVSKTGSDVNRLVLDILPILQPGVLVHFHDIFLPLDYPQRWVCELGFSWNEQYLLQAFLSGNRDWQIVYGSAIARERHSAALGDFLGEHPRNGGSLWLRRTG